MAGNHKIKEAGEIWSFFFKILGVASNKASIELATNVSVKPREALKLVVKLVVQQSLAISRSFCLLSSM